MMRRWNRIRSTRGDVGIGTLEYVGVITLTAVLIGAVLLSVTSLRAREHASAAACRVAEAFGLGGGCDPTPGRDPEDYVPPEKCVVASDGRDESGSLTVVVTLDSGERWVVEELGDGTYRLTRARDVGVGIGVGVGFDFSVTSDNETYGVGASASASAAVVVGAGESYIARSPEEARRILDHKRNDETKDLWFGDDNLVRSGADWLNERFGGSNQYEQLDPDEWFTEGGLEGQASAGATAIAVTADAEATLAAYLGRKSRKDGTSIDYLRASVGMSGGMEGYGVTSAGYDIYKRFTLDGEATAVVEVERDGDGEPVAFRLRSVTSWNPVGDESYSGAGGIDGNPSYTEQVVEIPLESAADRRLATRVMHTVGIPYYPGVTDTVDVEQALLDRFDPVGLGTELGQAAMDRGYVYEQTYTMSRNTDAVNAQGKYVVELGVNVTAVESRRATTGYRYYDGTGFVERPECVV